MGYRLYNIRLSPRGRTTSLVSPDGENWFTEDGKPVRREDIHHDSLAVDFLGALFWVGILASTLYVLEWYCK